MFEAAHSLAVWAGPFAAQVADSVTERDLLLIDRYALEDRGQGEGDPEWDAVQTRIAAIIEDLKVTLGMDIEAVPPALNRRVFTDPAEALSMAFAYLACVSPGHVGFLRDPPSTLSVDAGRRLLTVHCGSGSVRPRSHRATIASANKTVKPGPTPAQNLALVARLKMFDADAAKGAKVADRFLNTLLHMRLKAKNAVWSLPNMRSVQRLGEASPGPSLYCLLCPMSDVVHEEVVNRYLLLTEDERVALGLTNSQQRFMTAMVTNRNTEQGFLPDIKFYGYAGQVHSPKQKIKNRWDSHYGKSSKNLLVQMLQVVRGLVNGGDISSPGGSNELRVYPLYFQ